MAVDDEHPDHDAGLTRGSHPLTGAARVAGIVGAFVALLNVVLTVGGVVLG